MRYLISLDHLYAYIYQHMHIRAVQHTVIESVAVEMTPSRSPFLSVAVVAVLVQLLAVSQVAVCATYVPLSMRAYNIIV